MIVEDQAIIALDVQNTLSDHGAEFVAWANTVTQARNLLETQGPFQAALLDLQLGSEHGTDLLDDFDSRGIPVILTSGYSVSAGTRLKGRHMLEKPYEPDALVSAVLAAIEKTEKAG